jgi:hypothetical protein
LPILAGRVCPWLIGTTTKMNSMIERLETRRLHSASSYPVIVFPVIANDATVIADNQHLSSDKSQLALDTASFKALVASDKLTLSQTVSEDRSGIKADQAAVKADANDPTLLVPAQAALETAVVKLSGDTASLKTKLAVDSADQKAALGTDNLAMRTDQGFLRIDTQAAQAALVMDVKRLNSDIAAIEARGPALPAIAATLEADLNAAARGQVKPATSAIMDFAADLSTALNSGALSAKQESALAQDMVDVVNSEAVAADLTQNVVENAQALLLAGGATSANAQTAASALDAMVVS